MGYIYHDSEKNKQMKILLKLPESLQLMILTIRQQMLLRKKKDSEK